MHISAIFGTQNYDVDAPFLSERFMNVLDKIVPDCSPGNAKQQQQKRSTNTTALFTSSWKHLAFCDITDHVLLTLALAGERCRKI